MAELISGMSDGVTPAAAESESPCDGDLSCLLERSAAGDKMAFAELYDMTSARCYGLALRMLGDQSDAERVTRDAYLHMWTHALSYEASAGSPLAWITELVHRGAVAQLQLSRPRPGEPAPLDWDRTDARHALNALSPPSQKAVELAFFDGQLCSEVARRGNVTAAAAANLIRAGLLGFR